MGQMKPPSNSPKKPVVKPLRMKNVRPKSFFEEHYYAVLLAMLCIVTILLKAGGMSFKDASLAGLLFTALVFFATQVARYFKERSSPGAEAKIAARPPQADKKIPAAAPPTNAKTTFAAKQMDKRYPPPSPFIKPPPK